VQHPPTTSLVVCPTRLGKFSVRKQAQPSLRHKQPFSFLAPRLQFPRSTLFPSPLSAHISRISFLTPLSLHNTHPPSLSACFFPSLPPSLCSQSSSPGQVRPLSDLFRRSLSEQEGEEVVSNKCIVNLTKLLSHPSCSLAPLSLPPPLPPHSVPSKTTHPPPPLLPSLTTARLSRGT